jgi:hypothetical protein
MKLTDRRRHAQRSAEGASELPPRAERRGIAADGWSALRAQLHNV